MSILRQLNDEIIEKLRIYHHNPYPAPDEGNIIQVDEEFIVKITVINESQQFPQITYSDVFLELSPVAIFAVFKDAAYLHGPVRKSLGKIVAGQSETAEFTMVAKMAYPKGYDYFEPVYTAKIAANVLLRCKDLDNPIIHAHIHPKKVD